MYIHVMKSKIHSAVVTDAQLNYVGSITIDEELMDAAGLYPNEKVLVVNNNNGERLETYVIVGKRGSGVICLNGAAARKVQKGDVVIIISFAMIKKSELSTHEPSVVFPKNENKDFRTFYDVLKDRISEIYHEEGEISIQDLESLALEMGKTLEELKPIAEAVLKEKED